MTVCVTLMSEVFFTGRIVGRLLDEFQLRICAMMQKACHLDRNKAGSLPLSYPPSRFLSYPKIPLGGKVFVIDVGDSN